jgi:hypothetical protein
MDAERAGELPPEWENICQIINQHAAQPAGNDRKDVVCYHKGIIAIIPQKIAGEECSRACRYLLRRITTKKRRIPWISSSSRGEIHSMEK